MALERLAHATTDKGYSLASPLQAFVGFATPKSFAPILLFLTMPNDNDIVRVRQSILLIHAKFITSSTINYIMLLANNY